MTDLQSKILDIMKEIHSICIANDIKYTLCGGSMIGAVREKGIIPWDDDIDIFMTPDNYQKFVQIAKEYKSDKIQFLLPSNKNFIYPFIKAVDKNTTLIEKITSDHMKYTMGVFVDIFPLVSVKRVKNKLRTFSRFYILKCMLAKLAKTDLLTIQKIVKPFVALIPVSIFKKLLLMYNKSAKKSKFYYDPDGYSTKAVFPKEWMNEYTLMPFEDTEFYVMKEYDKYLTQVFGNYMQRPPVEEQASHHGFFYIDLDKPYKEYIEEKNNKK